MLQRVAPGAAQRTTVPGGAEIVASCACEVCPAEVGAGIAQASPNAPKRIPRRRMTIMNFPLRRESEVGLMGCANRHACDSHIRIPGLLHVRPRSETQPLKKITGRELRFLFKKAQQPDRKAAFARTYIAARSALQLPVPGTH